MKQQQAHLLIALQEHIEEMHNCRMNPVTDESVDYRESLKQRIHELNRTGRVSAP